MWPSLNMWPCPEKRCLSCSRVLVLVQPECVHACVQDSRGTFLRNVAVEIVCGPVSSNTRRWIGPHTQSPARERERKRKRKRSADASCQFCA